MDYSNKIIRPLEEDDLEFLIEVRNECRDKLHDNREFTIEEAKTWFNNIKPKFYLALIDNIKVGYFRTSNWDFVNKHIMIGMDLHKDFRGKGLGKQFYILFIDDLFKTYDFNKIKLEVLFNNLTALKFYRDLGFKLEGILHNEVYRDGKYLDSVVMSLFKSEWMYLKSNGKL